jgi:hypothetical protein
LLVRQCVLKSNQFQSNWKERHPSLFSILTNLLRKFNIWAASLERCLKTAKILWPQRNL